MDQVHLNKSFLQFKYIALSANTSSVIDIKQPIIHPPVITVQADAALAARLGFSLDASDADLALTPTPEGLALTVLKAPSHDETLGQGKPLILNHATVDSTSGQGRSLKQPIARALGLRKGEPDRPTVLDATAGLGEDAALIAGLGCSVTCLEQHPAVWALLHDATQRSVLNIQALLTQATDWIHQQPQRPTHDIVYLDPMFPSPHKRRALQRKPMRLLDWLLTNWPSPNEAALLQTALNAAKRRVVVKRPRKAPPLAGIKPATTHEGSAVRYDIYPVALHSSSS